MDTTSHNFIWRIFTFGGKAGSSFLYAVAIIDENNIWAVGEIYLKDSLENPDPLPYNAVHWNGSEWELKRIKTNDCGGVDYSPKISFLLSFSKEGIKRSYKNILHKYITFYIFVFQISTIIQHKC